MLFCYSEAASFNLRNIILTEDAFELSTETQRGLERDGAPIIILEQSVGTEDPPALYKSVYVSGQTKTTSTDILGHQDGANYDGLDQPDDQQANVVVDNTDQTSTVVEFIVEHNPDNVTFDAHHEQENSDIYNV